MPITACTHTLDAVQAKGGNEGANAVRGKVTMHGLCAGEKYVDARQGTGAVERNPPLRKNRGGGAGDRCLIKFNS